ncbi:MAG: hypothetical protein R3F07_01080 [Opitutaceae bacterium]
MKTMFGGKEPTVDSDSSGPFPNSESDSAAGAISLRMRPGRRSIPKQDAAIQVRFPSMAEMTLQELGGLPGLGTIATFSLAILDEPPFRIILDQCGRSTEERAFDPINGRIR